MMDVPAQPEVIVITAERPVGQAGEEQFGAIAIGPSEIRQSASGRLEDVLAQVSGIQSFRRSDSRSANPSAQGLTLRGLGGNASSRTLVLLDGIPLAEPFFGFVPFSAIDPSRLDRITILRGAGGGAFGSAVAGTIDLQSRAIDERDPFDMAIGASTRRSAELGVGATVNGKTSALAIDARIEAGDGFWTTPEDQRVPASARSAYRSRLFDGRAVVLVGGGELQGRLRAFDDERTLRFDGADNSMSGTDLSLRYVSADRTLTFAGWRQHRDFSNIVISSTRFVPVLDQYATPARTSGAIVQWRAVDGLTLGADAKISSGTAHERALSAFTGAVTADRANGGRAKEGALFAEFDVPLGSLNWSGSARLARWTLDQGRSIETDGQGFVRVDQRFPERGGTAFSGRTSLHWQRPGLGARLSAYRGFRLPTLNELYRGFTVFPVETRANAALRPERLNGVEATVEAQPAEPIRVAVTLFANRLSDAIANVTIGPNLRQRRNIDAIRSRGMELELEARHRGWTFDGSLSLISARMVDDGPLDGLRPAQVPSRSLAATLSRETGPWMVSATLRHLSSAYEEDLNQYRLGAATTVDAVIRRAIGPQWEVALRGENLLGERIVTRNQAGSIDLGTPRIVWLSLSFGATKRE
ncbi:TonB-dependent receptor [Sphingomonas xanthus]|uniref:TonB-dependent receptor n=1 Tax=Sphingomonas xanthus TaxID=2594473 RepID=A0A516IU63_9SPHN|nr:TonB-dependent receptor [Sphingomonas xanthus]QDP20384.1 TonB-dependent receptor [Sphingomonas xanthus]